MSMKGRIVLAFVLFSIAGTLPGEESIRHRFRAAQPEEAPVEVLLAVEIPAGGFTKFEINDEGLLFVDRFLSMPVNYPANYGSMPRTLAGDGDPLDALVLTRAPLPPGVLIRFRPVGVLRMTDKGEADEKIIGVPTDKVDPTYAQVRELTDLPEIERQRIEAFFRTYKDLPAGGGPVQLNGFGDAAEARADRAIAGKVQAGSGMNPLPAAVHSG